MVHVVRECLCVHEGWPNGTREYWANELTQVDYIMLLWGQRQLAGTTVFDGNIEFAQRKLMINYFKIMPTLFCQFG